MSLDINGKLYNISGDAENPVVTELEGWHVNSTELIAEWEQWRVNPTNPRQTIFGVETFFYRFDNEKQFNELLNQDGDA